MFFYSEINSLYLFLLFAIILKKRINLKLILRNFKIDLYVYKLLDN